MTKILVNGVGVPRGTLLDPRIDAGGGGDGAPKVVEWEWDFDQAASTPFEDFQLRIDDTGEILWYMSTDPLISSEGYLIATYTSEPGKMRVRLLTFEAAHKNISFRPYPEGQNSLTNGRIVENNTFSLVDGWWQGTVEAGAPAVTLKLDAPLTDMSSIQVSGIAEGLDSGGSFYIFVTVNNVFKATEVFIENSQNYTVVLDASSLIGSPGDNVTIRANNAGQNAIVNAVYPESPATGSDRVVVTYGSNPNTSVPANAFECRNNTTGEVFNAFDTQGLEQGMGVSFELSGDENSFIVTMQNLDGNEKSVAYRVLPIDQDLVINPVVTENSSFSIQSDGWVSGTLTGRDLSPSLKLVGILDTYTSRINNTISVEVANITNLSLEVQDANGHAMTDLNRTISSPLKQVYSFQYQSFTNLDPGPITIRAYSNSGIEDSKNATYSPED